MRSCLIYVIFYKAVMLFLDELASNLFLLCYASIVDDP